MHNFKSKMKKFFQQSGRSLTLVFLMMVVLSLSCRDAHETAPPSPDDTGKFRNPVLTAGPDPWVIEKNDTYYVTHTTGNSLKLYETQAMSQLGQATSKTIWTPPSSGPNSKEIWAPEIHFVNNAWYFYYAADDGNNANHRMWVLENTSPDPFQGTWTDKGQLHLPDDKWAIDGTIFELQGQLYFLWSGWEGDTNVEQDIYITRMADPLTPTGNRQRLSAPQLSWETSGSPPAVNEGPQFLQHGDEIFIVYSAGGCWTDDYSLGLLSASATADPMDASAWTKSTTPLLSKYPEGQAFGPGHCSFFSSPDSTEDWILYHANPQSGQGCGNKRSIRMQPYRWSADGLPQFDKPAALDVALPKPSGE
jgi:GH43 family beta-xylosidase